MSKSRRTWFVPLVRVLAGCVLVGTVGFTLLHYFVGQHYDDLWKHQDFRIENKDLVPSPQLQALEIAPLPWLPLPQAASLKAPSKTQLTEVTAMPIRPWTHSGRPRIAIVIDDCGLSVFGTRAAMELPAEVTLSFLPYGEMSHSLAVAARQRGHSIMLHMPMQPMGDKDPGPEALTVNLDAPEITARLQRAFAALPAVDGMNNHMGSRFTADAAGMAPVLHEVKTRGIFFLDSVTSGQSVAAQLAQQAGIPSLKRNVFLDDSLDPTAITGQLRHLEIVAERHGAAIAIGHPHAVTLGILKPWLNTLSARGFELVRVGDLLKNAAAQ
jgi:uncharacterized protein